MRGTLRSTIATDAYITGLEGVDSSFADDAGLPRRMVGRMAGQEGWFGGNPETESETHLVAFYENGAVVTVDHGTPVRPPAATSRPTSDRPQTLAPKSSAD